MHAYASNEVGGRVKTPVHLWIVAVLSLLWNLVGAFDYLATQTKMESYMSQFTQEQLDYFYSIPAWAVSGWAIGVWGAVVGSVGLLLRKRWAEWAFCLSLVGMAVSTIHSFLLSNGLEIMGSGAVVFSLVIWIVAIFLYVYSRKQAKAGVLT
jgi:hypothetical protein